MLMGGQEAGGKSLPADRRLARIEEHDIVRHQREQAGQITGIDGADPGRMNLADISFLKSHLLPPPPVAKPPNDQAQRLGRNANESGLHLSASSAAPC